MSLLNNLPFTNGARILVIDEDIHANYAQLLLMGWLLEYKQKKPEQSVLVVLFSSPKSTYLSYFDKLNLKNVEIRDFYTIDIKENQNNISEKLDNILSENLESHVVVIDCLSSLSLSVGKQKASTFVEKFSRKVSQLICINQSDFNSQNIPRIDTFGDVYLKLKPYSDCSLKNSFSYMVESTCKKPSGSVTKQTEYVSQDADTYSIVSTKKDLKKITADREAEAEVLQATFRLLALNKREIAQKKSVDLPYTKAKSSASKIIYTPDNLDDLDEEDPDDDLCI